MSLRTHRTCVFCASQGPGALRGAAAAVAALHDARDRDATRARLVELLVALPPDPPADERGFGDDLARRTTASLRAEAARLRFGLMFHPSPPPWWAERLTTIREVLHDAR